SQDFVVNRYWKRRHRIHRANHTSSAQSANASASIDSNNFLRCNSPRLDLSLGNMGHQADQAGAIWRLGVEDIPDDEFLKQRLALN
ncbi:MAG: hypothetical protein ACREEK_08215, partial [Bradyrhizobium sp.]